MLRQSVILVHAVECGHTNLPYCVCCTHTSRMLPPPHQQIEVFLQIMIPLAVVRGRRRGKSGGGRRQACHASRHGGYIQNLPSLPPTSPNTWPPPPLPYLAPA